MNGHACVSNYMYRETQQLFMVNTSVDPLTYHLCQDTYILKYHPVHRNSYWIISKKFCIFFIWSCSWCCRRYNVKCIAINGGVIVINPIKCPTWLVLNSLWSNWVSSLPPPALGIPRAIFSLMSRSLSFCKRVLTRKGMEGGGLIGNQLNYKGQKVAVD